MNLIHTRDQAKAYAKSLRAEHASRNQHISYSAALECVAKELGYSDWNTLSARLSNKAERPVQVGDRVVGQYLNQSISGYVLGLQELTGSHLFAVTIDFDEPVDVVTFDSFSNFRRRIRTTISKDGISYHKSSDGVPHLIISPDKNCELV